ncbi:hypothetical protein IHQ71_04300 [Rhizobium sp. TH2]|uniref:hypothetical protein n=1 Tax=Rhizobium sp. TH2 TaxID=2775403 RepID=UPI0021570603|nr:hypothetical protein [Rhizobium sp. TH2]UVC09842.1 hypothetical protein IHQ71_04300 [Rhizobium sp. TH2]
MSGAGVEQHFESPKALIDHARNNLYRLDVDVTDWTNSGPYQLTEAFDEVDGMDVFTLRLREAIPKRFSLQTFDIVGELRSALDQAVHACAANFGNAPSSGLHFPIAERPEGLTNALDNGGSRNIPAQIRPFFRAFGTHKMGNPTIWALNKLRNTKMHALLIHPCVATNGVVAVPHMEPGQTSYAYYGRQRFRIGPWQDAENGMEIFACSHGVERTFHLEVDAFLTVGNSPLLVGKSLTGILNAMAGEVERIVTAIETETARIVALGTP